MRKGTVPLAAELLADGVLGRRDAVVSVTEWHGQPGSGEAERLLRTRIMRGLDVDVIPSRGFDIGDVSFRGIPLSWFSPIRDARALANPTGAQWASRFNGGLVTTCGLNNFGPARGNEGLHGNFSHLPARDVSWQTFIEGAETRIELTATIDSVQLFGPSFTLERHITSTLSADQVATLRVRDIVTNIGTEPAPVSALYHLNFGAPLVVPGTSVTVNAATVTMREPCDLVPSPRVIPAVTSVLTEAVFEHSGLEPDADGFGEANIRNEDLGVDVTVRWKLSGLPRLLQWVFPTRDRWALGIEPANAPLFGPDRDGVQAGAPSLAPQASCEFEVVIAVQEIP